jgi:ribosomal protein S18 acetylase RimI-like enzyme
MVIRRGDLKDLNACALIDTSYVTDNVWQVRTEERPYEEIVVTFQAIRLPRSVRAKPPRDTEFLVQDWQRDECFLVAEEDGEIRGYLNMVVQPWHSAGWINDIAVRKRCRRQGIASELLRAAFRWAREHGLRTVLAETQTKNHPAICLCRKHGFVFCGFNDQYYSNQDIAVFFARSS